MKYKIGPVLFLLLLIPILCFPQKKYLSINMGVAFSSAKERLNGASKWFFQSNETPANTGNLSHIGFAGNLKASFLLGKKFGADVGFGFLDVGYNDKGFSPVSVGERKTIRHFNYLSFPLSMKYFFDKKRNYAIYLGGSFVYLAQQKIFIKGKGGAPDFNLRNNQLQNFHRANQFIFIGGTWAKAIDEKFDFICDLQIGKSILDFDKHGLNDLGLYHIYLSPTIGLQYAID